MSVCCYVRFRSVPPKSELCSKIQIQPKSIISSYDAVSDRTYRFDGVIPATSSQDDVYNTCAIDPVLTQCFSEGTPFTAFAFGSTGSGKTYTMFGDESLHGKGIVPRAVSSLFQLALSCSPSEMKIGIEFLEVHKELVYDLLGKSRVPLKVHLHSKHAVVQGVSEHVCFSVEAALALVREGREKRAVSSTLLNGTSSRSHAILSFTLSGQFSSSLTHDEESTLPSNSSTRGDGIGGGNRAFGGVGNKRPQRNSNPLRFTFVDLAGSENSTKAGISGANLQVYFLHLSCLSVVE
jgi:hypothetical protein